MNNISLVADEIKILVGAWESVLSSLPDEVISQRKNKQGRTIKMITGHIIDSASNNTHRMVHLQYQKSPLSFPNYATNGNNDRWIAIQDYQNEDWSNMVQLWKFSLLHVSHVMRNVDTAKLENQWLAGDDENISLETMINGFTKHLRLHLDEIRDLMEESAPVK